ncbi:Ger(x)C family spore germination protein [Alicyclobacillus fastidiosus]|uniref:Ger(X)C family spore germination protein n=1 Tax=Alicyclobacillus fastidiosus TaxID=392011 RepID=A0ABV5A8X2_9BACL|nr:Ger(x)C family spore germination protein [Alicyclobacillus fastidiosus]WEH11999.1 Ger(x)C family spore germination protein [Alicyclobacillus fastidiosus]
MLLCLVFPFFLSGCWDAVELQQRAIVLMIGIDPSPEATGDVRVTLQLARPQQLSTPPKPETTSGENSTVVIAENGADVSEAVRKIQLATDRKLFFEHVRAIVVNQAVAKHGMLPMFDSIVQARIAPRDAWLFVSSNSAQEVLGYAPALDAIPSTYLTNFFENRLLLNRSYDATIGGFHQRLLTPGVEPFAIWVGPGIKEFSAPGLKGIAAFSGDKFVGGLDQQEALGWQFITNQFPRSLLTLTCPASRSTTFVVNVRSVKSSITVAKDGASAPHASIQVRVKGWIEGGGCVTESSPEELDTLTRQVEKEVGAMVKSSIMQSQTFDSDLFGFGKKLYLFTPRNWQGDTKWRQAFHKLTVTVKVDAQLAFLQTYQK